MTRKMVFAVFVFLIYASIHDAYAQSDYKNHRVFLLGNLEELAPNAPEFGALEQTIIKENTPYSIIVNGDFAGKTGWLNKPTAAQIGRVDKLISLAKSPGGSIIFVPGDKEWDNGGLKGTKKVQALENYIEQQLGKGKVFFPQQGCLGPEVTDISDHVRVIAINSQWFMQKHRPEEEDANCAFLTDIELWDELGSLLSDSENKNIIVAIHHPLLSYGQYAGYKLGGMHFSPPIIGSFKAAYRRHIGGDKGLNNVAFKSFRNKLLLMSREHQGIIFTSGHEYDLQILKQDGNYHINSGSLSKSKPVAKKAASMFSKNARGIVQLNFLEDGGVNVDILELSKNNNLNNIYHEVLFNSPCFPNKGDFLSLNQFFTPCPDTAVKMGTPPELSERGSGIASTDYAKGKSGQFWLGKLYREEWNTEVHNIPYLDVGSTEGGLIPYARGGAGETTSLKFKTKDGRRFAFRSVDKNPQRHFEDDVKNFAIGKLTKDLIAHQHPYAALITKTFLDELDLRHSDPVLYLMPDDPRLGRFQEEFAGMLGTFEIKPRGKKNNIEGFDGADEVASTFEMYRRLFDDPSVRIDQLAYAKARLFDIWLADWDRHEDNWKWLGYKEGERMRYKVFPKDKDKVMAVLDGLYTMIDWEWVSPSMASFKNNYRGLKSLNFKSRNMDRILLSELTTEKWIQEAEYFKKIMTDEVIDRALTNMPKEVQKISGDELKRVLKIRRDLLPDAIREYCKLLSKISFVIGTNQKDDINIVRMKNGDVQVTIFETQNESIRMVPLYDRIFNESETEEIRIYGLGKDDKFTISGASDKSIAIRIIGGKGEDSIDDKSIVKEGKSTFVYDYRQKDKVNLGTNGKVIKTNEEMIFSSQNLFNYNYAVTLPQVGFNSDDGFIAGINYNNIKQDFGKRDFSSKSSFRAIITSGLNFNIEYEKTFRRASSTWDVVVGIQGADWDRTFQRFYGLGNESVFDNDLKQTEYYRNRSSKYGVNLGLEKEFWGRSSFTPSIRVERNNIKPRPLDSNNESIYDALPTSIGLGAMTLVGLQFDLNLDLTDNSYLPTRGVKFKMSNYSFYNSRAEFGIGGRVDAEGSIYLSARDVKPITLAIRAGYSKTFGDTPFYHKSAIGQQANHRGYNRNRFIGDSAAFINNDLRMHVGSIKTPLIPIKFGIMGLYDIGRVWIVDDVSTKWHKAWGGGFYVVPWKDQFNIGFTYAKSDEQAIITFGLGLALH